MHHATQNTTETLCTADRTVLVVGGAGFIGSYVNKMLHRAGYKTVVLDNLSSGKRESVRYGTFIEGDTGNRQTLDALFTRYRIDAVMHFAAFIDVGESVSDPIKYYENNVVSTLTLLKAMVKHNVKKFIFSSSAAVFGIPEILPIPENHPCRPINPYGETKRVVETILQNFDSAYDLKFCSFRYFNAAGGDPEGEIGNYQTGSTNLIPRIVRSLQTENGSVTIFGTKYPTRDGTCIRDYVHIHDLGTAHIKGLERLFSGKTSSYFNLGNGQGYTVHEIIRTVESVTGRKVNVIIGPPRAGDPPRLVADASKAIEELGWQPQFSSPEIIIRHAWGTLR